MLVCNRKIEKRRETSLMTFLACICSSLILNSKLCLFIVLKVSIMFSLYTHYVIAYGLVMGRLRDCWGNRHATRIRREVLSTATRGGGWVAKVGRRPGVRLK